MTFHEDIAQIAALCGDTARAQILIALMEGKALTAGELARTANISAQAASNHLAKLVQFNLVTCKPSGRHRYYQLASNKVATMLESISVLIPQVRLSKPAQDKKIDKELCFARTCYNHLAGKLGVSMTKALCEKNFLILRESSSFQFTDEGVLFFKQQGIDIAKFKKQKANFAKPCLDWTEREYHLAGMLGTAFLSFFVEQHLIIKSKQKPRVVILTEKGKKWLYENFSLQL